MTQSPIASPLAGAVAAFAMLLHPAAALAHGGEEHVMGTVKAVDDKLIQVQSKGKEVTIQLDSSTKFEKGGTVASVNDVTTGDRVVVHAKKTDAGLKADTVKIGAPGKKRAGAEGTQHGEHAK